MFKRGKSSNIPAAAAAAAVVGEVPVHKVDRIEVLNLVAANKPAGHVLPGSGNPWKPAHPTAAAAEVIVDGSGAGAGPARTKPADCRRPDDDINSRACRFIEDTKKRWYLGLKSFRATGR